MTKKTKNKIAVVGDLHLSTSLKYADYVDDRRVAERKEILDFIVEQSKDCERVVLLGDLFHNRNNSSELIREMVEFLERFEGKELFILGGNHDKISTHKNTTDFLGEIKNHNWHIITDKITTIDEFDFIPYMIAPELGTKDYKEATKRIVASLKGNRILFAHYAISGTETSSGATTDLFDEIVLPKNKLEEKYELIFGGHVHSQQKLSKKTIISGSIFCSEINEHEKFIWKINEKTLAVEQIKLPGRGIFNQQDPLLETEFDGIPDNSIVKIILTDRKINIENVKKWVERFDGHSIIEQYLNIRKKIEYGNEDVLNMSVENLLKLYSKARKVSLDKLKVGWDIIK